MWRLERHPTHDGWQAYDLFLDEELVASAKWRVVGEFAELHNDVYHTSKTVLVAARQAFEALKAEMRAAGLKLVVVLSDHCDKKMKRYWRFMGFTYFTQEHGLDCAVMEV